MHEFERNLSLLTLLLALGEGSNTESDIVVVILVFGSLWTVRCGFYRGEEVTKKLPSYFLTSRFVTAA